MPAVKKVGAAVVSMVLESGSLVGDSPMIKVDICIKKPFML